MKKSLAGKFSLILLLLVSFIVTSSSQASESLYLNHLQDSVHTQITKVSSLRKSIREHQLYLTPEFQHCIIETTRGETFHTFGRYSVLDNALEWKYGDKVGMIHPGRIKAVLVGQNLMVPINKDQLAGGKQNTYLEVLAAGRLNLYVHHFLESRMEGSNGLTSNYNGKKSYFIKNRFLVSEGNGKIKRLKTRKKAIKALFKNFPNEMEAFLKKRDYKFNDKEDLREIFTYYNQLTDQTNLQSN